MEGNQARTAVNWLSLQERSGKLWVFLLVIIALGVVAGPDWSPSGPQETQQRQVDRCTPMPVLPSTSERTIELLTENGWTPDRTGTSLVPAGCEGVS